MRATARPLAQACVFHPSNDPAARQGRGAPSGSVVIEIDASNRHSDGRERARCGATGGGGHTITEVHVIEPPDRIASTGSLLLGGAVGLVAPPTFDLAAANAGTRR